MQKNNKLVYGVGVNDADYAISSAVNGGRVMCSFYQSWNSMLGRCYSYKYQASKPSYKGCKAAPEWLTFMNFKYWMMDQDWKGKQLDKDLLIPGNKIYSPDTCCFVSRAVNAFLTDHSADRGEWPVGVSLQKNGKFRAYCSNPFTKKVDHLGTFSCPEEAYLAWRRKKHDHAIGLSEMQTDERVKAALIARYQ